MSAEAAIRAYYAAFNAGDRGGFLALMTEDVIHDISQGGREIGRDAFARFMEHMNRCYRERIVDLVVMTAPVSDSSEQRAAAEFSVEGTYLATDPGVPVDTAPASGQSYVLPAGAFFVVRDGRIARVSNHYNFGEWVRQVGRAG